MMQFIAMASSGAYLAKAPPVSTECCELQSNRMLRCMCKYLNEMKEAHLEFL